MGGHDENPTMAASKPMRISGRAELDGEGFRFDDLGLPIRPIATEWTPHRRASEQAARRPGILIRRTSAPTRAFRRSHRLFEQERLVVATAAYHRGDMEGA
ncbi:hypothetical protein A8F11_23470 [Burkholderia cenocepacia]|nr:hypothetical protein A8E56_37540 [Burkholderia cenocepacia]ONU32381.1 hypothetical protein A8E54_27395 [Burkholderia cenocepacia]ONW82696.1 hypothetical protein A8F07_25380 [Burkholderia cenocepacia]ONX41080.1 hypothetical protein A8F11_23470 [Burkholderia cenocepacia]